MFVYQSIHPFLNKYSHNIHKKYLFMKIHLIFCGILKKHMLLILRIYPTFCNLLFVWTSFWNFLLKIYWNAHIQGGQNFFEKIRTFSDEIRTIRTIFDKKNPYNPYIFLKSVQSVQFSKKSLQSVHLRKIKPF